MRFNRRLRKGEREGEEGGRSKDGRLGQDS